MEPQTSKHYKMIPLIRPFLLPQIVSWIVLSRISDLTFRVQRAADHVSVQSTLDLLEWVADWIDWALNPILLGYEFSKAVALVLWEETTRPISWAILLYADYCLQPVYYVADFVLSFLQRKLRVASLAESAKVSVPGFKYFHLGSVIPVKSLLPNFSSEAAATAEEEEREDEVPRMAMQLAADHAAEHHGPVGKMVTKVGVTKAEVASGGREHKKVEDYATSVGVAVSHAFWQYLSNDEGQEAIKNILLYQSSIAQKLSVAEGTKSAMRLAGTEACLGAYAGAEEKVGDLTAKLPAIVTKAFLPVVVCYGFLFASGLLFALLRFAFFGLH